MKKLGLLLVCIFVSFRSFGDYNICTVSKVVCSSYEVYYFYYVGNSCNCCPEVPAGAANVDVYNLYGWCPAGIEIFSRSYSIPSGDAAWIYQEWGGFCGSCV